MTQLLQNAAYGTALILAAALLRRVLKDRLIPGARLALWAVCLFRLLTPAAPESVLSLWGFFRPRQAPAVSASTSAPAPVSGTPQAYVPAQTAPSPAAPAIPWETVLLAVWLAVGVALAVRYALSWARTRRAVACAIPVERDDPRYLPLPRCARLREGPMEGAPLTFGAVKPTVVLSPGLEGEALRCVLAHEGVHASRRDNLWHYAMAVALIVHWWNPAVWLMARILRRDIELSCDRAALKKLGADRRAEYANALVTMAVQEDGPAFCQAFGRKAAEERILSVMKFKKTSVIGVILSLALVLAVTAAFASEPKEPDAPDTLVVDGVTLTGDAAKYASQLYPGMTRDEVHRLLGEPHSMLSGMYGDIYILNKLGNPLAESTFDDPAFIIYYDYEDFHGGTSKVYHVKYRVGDGEHVDLIRSAAGEDQPTYVDPDSTVDPSLREALEAAWRDRIQAAVKDFLEKDKAVNDPAPCTRMDCANQGIHTHDGVSYGATLAVCTLDDCGNNGVHTHNGVSYKGWTNKYAIPPACPPEAIDKSVSYGVCGVEGCAETRYHAHNEGRTILLSDPCPVEGCTITGNHLHGGVSYSCSGAGHHNGVCDGSCYTYNEPADYVDPPAQNAGSGQGQGSGYSYSHHGESHHGNGHH